MRNAGEEISEEDKLNQLLLCLPECYAHMINIVDALPEKERSVDNMKSKLLLEHSKKEESRFDELQSFNSGNFTQQNCYGCNQPGHYQRDCPRNERKFSNWRGNFNFRGNSYMPGNYFWRGQTR